MWISFTQFLLLIFLTVLMLLVIIFLTVTTEKRLKTPRSLPTQQPANSKTPAKHAFFSHIFRGFTVLQRSTKKLLKKVPTRFRAFHENQQEKNEAKAKEAGKSSEKKQEEDPFAVLPYSKNLDTKKTKKK